MNTEDLRLRFDYIENEFCRYLKKRKQSNYEVSIKELHKEILEFCDNVSPTQAEKTMRNEAVQRIRSVINSKWPRADVRVFGSFNTGLYLPTSDIDLVVFGHEFDLTNWDVRQELGEALRKIAAPGSFTILYHIPVPIVKFRDKESEVNIDISFNLDSGLKSADKVKTYLRQYPILEKMILVTKQFLLQRNLNEVYTGGVGSYSLTLMIVSFFQQCHRSELQGGNLGALLLKFFNHYKEFDYTHKTIRLDGIGYCSSSMYNNALYIIDPVDPEHKIKVTWDMWRFKHAFKSAHDTLTGALESEGTSFLNSVVSVSAEVKSYRRRVQEKWGHAVSGYHNSQLHSNTTTTGFYNFHGLKMAKFN